MILQHLLISYFADETPHATEQTKIPTALL